MSDNQKTSAVLAEYRIDRQAPVAPGVTRITAGHDGEAMADEIARLRDENATLRAEIYRLRVRCRQIDDEAFDYAEQIEQLKAAAKDSADNYADARAEIDRLRERLAAVEAENGLACRLVAKMHLAATGETTGPTLGVVEDVLALRQRADRAERILAALREPSANVIESANVAFPFAAPMIRAAVAAAEQEVGRE